jgi:hypothetical protein
MLTALLFSIATSLTWSGSLALPATAARLIQVPAGSVVEERPTGLEAALWCTGEEQARARTEVLRAGAQPLPELFEVLANKGLPARDAGPARSLDEQAKDRLLALVRELGRPVVLPFLSARLAAEPSLEERRAGLSFLGTCARLEDLAIAFQWADGCTSAYEGLGDQLQVLVACLLAPAPADCLRLAAILPGLDAARQEAGLLGAEAHPCRELCLLFVRLLGKDEALDPSLISRLGKQWGLHSEWVEERHLELIRGLVSSGSEAIAGQALTTLGIARDEASLPLMVSALRAPRRIQRIAAHQALESFSGLRIRSDLQFWDRILERSQVWERTRGQLAQEALHSGDAGQVALFLREISEQRLARDRWSQQVCSVFDRGDQTMSLQACAALSALGSGRAVPRLLQLMEVTTDQRLRDVACQTLCSITGLSLPPEVRRWREELGLP